MILKNLLIHLHSTDGISHKASAIGKSLYMDKAIMDQLQLDFARIYDKVDARRDSLEYVKANVGNSIIAGIKVNCALATEEMLQHNSCALTVKAQLL